MTFIWQVWCRGIIGRGGVNFGLLDKVGEFLKIFRMRSLAADTYEDRTKRKDSREVVLNNSWIHLLVFRDKAPFSAFLKRNHPIKIEIFSQIDSLSDDEILRRADRYLATAQHTFSHYYNRHLTLRELYLHPTIGMTDLRQVLFTVSIQGLPEEIDRWLEVIGEEMVRTQIESRYLLLKALEILSRKEGLVLIQEQDVEELVHCLTTLSFFPSEMERRLLLLSDLLMPVDTLQKQESLKNLLALIARLQSQDSRWQEVLATEANQDKIEFLKTQLVKATHLKNFTILKDALLADNEAEAMHVLAENEIYGVYIDHPLVFVDEPELKYHPKFSIIKRELKRFLEKGALEEKLRLTEEPRRTLDDIMELLYNSVHVFDGKNNCKMVFGYKLDEEGQEIKVFSIDTGPGISKIPKAVDEAGFSTYQGTAGGIGLGYGFTNILKRLRSLRGGELIIDSKRTSYRWYFDNEERGIVREKAKSLTTESGQVGTFIEATIPVPTEEITIDYSGTPPEIIVKNGETGSETKRKRDLKSKQELSPEVQQDRFFQCSVRDPARTMDSSNIEMAQIAELPVPPEVMREGGGAVPFLRSKQEREQEHAGIDLSEITIRSTPGGFVIDKGSD